MTQITLIGQVAKFYVTGESRLLVVKEIVQRVKFLEGGLSVRSWQYLSTN
jgi:hypothetical protein